MSTTNGLAQNGTRFSLLLLEDGEVLLSDFAVQYRFIPDVTSGAIQNTYPERLTTRSGNNIAEGRIKIGTRNLFFDSQNWRDAIIRIPLASVKNVKRMKDGSRSQHSDNSNLSQSDLSETFDPDRSVMVYATSATLQRRLGTDHPYTDVQMRGKHIFTPLYLSSWHVLDEISRLLQITSIPSRRQRDEQLRSLVRIREHEAPFDITLLEHGVEETTLMNTAASAVYALSRAPGRLRITRHNLYFMPIHGESLQAVERISLKAITSIRRLKHGCRDAAIEVGYTKVHSPQASQNEKVETFMVSFERRQLREKAIEVLFSVIEHDVIQYTLSELANVQRNWRSGSISNFDYLMYLNLAAGRSFNDLSQYPVFPWVLKDYKSKTLNLEDASSFRDLSKPIGALNSSRFDYFKQRFDSMPPPRFFYGTHYSTPAYTINYLVRAAPAAMLRLQNGKFDTPDRLFNSISSCWDSVLSNRADVKELIPEFYVLDYSNGNSSGIVSENSSPGEFLDNVLGLELGIRQDGKRVDDVELPPWANGSSRYFIRRNREALETEYVSDRLHLWIDLIFGFKSKTEEASNIFYTDVHLPSDINQTQISTIPEDEIQRLETIALEFGMTPTRLFHAPHPPRFGEKLTDTNNIDPSSSKTDVNSVPKLRPILENVARDGDGTIIESIMNSNKPHSEDSAKNHNQVFLSNDRISTPRKIWGARSRREDSVLKGATQHILFSYEPSSSEQHEAVQSIPERQMSRIIPTDDNLREIIDMCLVQESNTSTTEIQDIPTICTIWDDGYLKVHSERRVMRSKYIGEACSVIYIGRGVVAYGLRSGGIGLYYIETGRLEIIEPGAHDAEVESLAYTSYGNALVSGSLDASIKIWHVEHPTHNSVTFRLIQELDGESGVDDVSVTIEHSSMNQKITHLLVAVSTTEGMLMAWEINSNGEADHFVDPIWRAQVTIEDREYSTRKRHKLAWLYQGSNRRPALGSVHDTEKCLRVWKLNQIDMAAVEVMLIDDGAHMVVACDDSRTLLVGGMNGKISEFDSTGLCLGSVVVGTQQVRHVLLPKTGDRMYVFAGGDQALRVKR